MSETGPDEAAISGHGDVLLTSLLILLLVLVLGWLLLRFGVAWLRGIRSRALLARDSPIRLLGRASLDAHHGLHVIAAGDKTLLVASSAHGVSVLAELDGEAVARDLERARSVRRPFQDWLRAALERPRQVPAETPKTRRGPAGTEAELVEAGCESGRPGIGEPRDD